MGSHYEQFLNELAMVGRIFEFVWLNFQVAVVLDSYQSLSLSSSNEAVFQQPVLPIIFAQPA